MSQHQTPGFAHCHGRQAFAILRSLAAAIALGFIGSASAADPKNASAPMPDVVLARAALAALDADGELKGVNLVVSVVDRVAVIGGPVASARQSQRAEQVVRAVAGIEEVRNACFVSIGPDPLLRSVADRLGSSLPPRPSFFALPGVLTNQFPDSVPAPAAPFTGSGLVAATNPPSTSVSQRPPLLPVATGLLGAPVGPAGSDSVAYSPSQSSTAPGVLTGTQPSMGDVLTAAGEVRKAEARFAKLTVEMRDGMLVIGGTAPRATDAWDFAKKVRLIPGVPRIAIGAVAAK